VPLEEILGLTKADLVDSIAAEADLSKRQAAEIVDLFLDEIKTALQKGDRVALTPFGSFVVRHRKAREGRNPKTGEKIRIAARKVPAFVSGKALKDAVGGARPAAKKSAAKKSAAKKSPAKKKARR
jgi:DNA-binding protein HU-alpha